MIHKELIQKYNVPGPRYTSYPTVPHWSKTPTEGQWKTVVQNSFIQSNETEGISLYIHLPFCSSLCTYCGCNKRITCNHAVEKPYIDAVLREWQMYVALMQGEKPRIREIHLGGGTPTFFSPENLTLLLHGILEAAVLCHDAELSFEAHPNSTSLAHLKALYTLGFRRLSLGIQDFDPSVQFIINRIQSYETVKEVTEQARAVGYTSINYDLIYGLPLQTLQSVSDTLDKVAMLRPDRIAFYSYAHVPWVSKSQRRYSEEDLPDGETKRALYEMGKERFEAMGYSEIGMDHFALETDMLFKNRAQLHRNFMGYTPHHTTLLLALGVSSISDAWWGFAQNEKTIEEYYARIEKGELPIIKGHLLDAEDERLRRHILNIMCRFETEWTAEEAYSEVFQNAFTALQELQNDGLVEISGNKLRVPAHAKPFVRNICMCFDAYLQAAAKTEKPIFSKTI